MSRIEKSVCDKIIARSKKGKEKYGVTMERGDLTNKDWMIHLSEELMDATVYLERLITRETALEGQMRQLIIWWREEANRSTTRYHPEALIYAAACLEKIIGDVR